eukprot:RCo017168
MKGKAPRHLGLSLCVVVAGLLAGAAAYSVPDTGQTFCTTLSNTHWSVATCPSTLSPYYGQDASYTINPPGFIGSQATTATVTDTVTGLMWTNHLTASKLNYAQAVSSVSSVTTGGYTDWRLPTIKELFSLINYNGVIQSAASSCTGVCTPFVNTTAFQFLYGLSRGETREIDSQFVTSTQYVSTVMSGQQCVFGVNLADGRIKCYPLTKNFEVLYVRGTPTGGSVAYGTNTLTDMGDQTIVDSSTGLQWMKADSGSVSGAGSMDWPSALQYCEASTVAGYSDWRLPTAKEAQSISDYTRSPKTTSSPALPAIFMATSLTVEDGSTDWGWEWTSTTLYDGNVDWAIYVTRGRAMGYMNGAWIDVHGAGAVRSDPKIDDGTTYPNGHGPQGDAVRVKNFVRCVRTTAAAPAPVPACYFPSIPANSLTSAPSCGAYSSSTATFTGSCTVDCATGYTRSASSPSSVSCTTSGALTAGWSCVSSAPASGCYFSSIPANSLTTGTYCGAYNSATKTFTGTCSVGCKQGFIRSLTSPATVSCTGAGAMSPTWQCLPPPK